MSADPNPETVSTAGTARPAPTRRRWMSLGLLIVVVALLGVSLVLPWWSESQVSPDGVRSTQDYAPLTGVTGTCSPACSAFLTGPPIGPIVGTHSFSSLGLNRTATLYYATVGLVWVGLVGSAVAAGTLPSKPSLSPDRRRSRFHIVSLSLALLATSAACAALAAVQPMAFRADTAATFAPNAAWTASPSPETSFWGSCVPGPTNGICASGWSATWGPGLGWFLIAVAAVVLVLVLLLRIRRPPRSPPPSAPE